MGENGNSNTKIISLWGFDVQGSVYRDGIRDLTNAAKDMYNVDAVEVTKGTVGADNGRAVPAGYINCYKTAKMLMKHQELLDTTQNKTQD